MKNLGCAATPHPAPFQAPADTFATVEGNLFVRRYPVRLNREKPQGEQPLQPQRRSSYEFARNRMVDAAVAVMSHSGIERIFDALISQSHAAALRRVTFGGFSCT
ncbi:MULTISPECIES: hypothetical protein [unclassified Bradyrhizobium]|uniref:hypothetical protein n=1 Tax=unclassified Bradyrhizobium TaxID=2631580 RepID=UPI0028E45AAA|nr:MULTISPECIES: hypothetical protein [unclassified Bradyrhizobium]